MQFCAPQFYGYSWCKNHEEEVAVNIDKRPLRLGIPLLLLVPILGMALGLATMFLLNLDGSDYGNLIVNLFFLIGVIVLIRLFKFSSEDLGVKIIK